MAKRFTCTDKWKKRFMRDLEAPYKLLWLYMLDDCNHAGLWIVDLEVAGIRLGFQYDYETTKQIFSSKIVEADGGEIWFIPSFIFYQYKELNPENRAHSSVIKELQNKGLLSTLQGAMDMDKDKDMDKDMDKEKEKKEKKEIVMPFDTRDFIDAWKAWKRYKREQFKFTYKPSSEQGALTKLSKLTDDPVEAVEIIMQSIANGWKGLFDLKDKNGREADNTSRAIEFARRRAIERANK